MNRRRRKQIAFHDFLISEKLMGPYLEQVNRLEASHKYEHFDNYSDVFTAR